MSMNILLENGNVNPPSTEGTANILLTHAKELTKRGHKIVILTREKSIITGKKYPKYEKSSNLVFYRWSNYAELFFLYRKIIKKEKIDIIHIFSKGLRNLNYIMFLKNFIKKPVIFNSIGFPNTEEDTFEKFNTDGKTSLKLIRFVENVDLMAITSRYIHDQHPVFRRKNCFYVPYGIDIERFSKKLKKKSDSGIRIAYLRNPKKNLLDAFQKLLDELPKVIFIFNKSYIEKNKLLREFFEKNSGKVRLIEELKNISDLFNDVEIVIDTHDTQKYLECASPPLLLLEAMACETIVISSKMGEIEEFIEDGKNGFLISDNTSEQIYLALKKALKSKKSVEKNARRTIVDRYDIKKIADEYEIIYKTLGKKRHFKGNL